MDAKALSYVSPSKLEAARLCEARLYARLHDDDYEEEQGEPALIGTLAHCAAKIWYRPKDFKRDAQGNITETIYGATDLDATFKEALAECKEPERHTGRPQMPGDPSGIQEARTMFGEIVAHYKRDAIVVLATERRYKGTMANGVPVHLIIDLVVQRATDRIEIVDYKTGFLAVSTEDMYDKDQCLMNLMAVMRDAEFAAYKTVAFSYYWIRKGTETGPISLTPERLVDYEQFLSYEYQRLLDVKEPVEHLNRFCKSCGRRLDCGKFRQFVSEAMGKVETYTPEQMKGLTQEDLLAQFDKLKGQEDMVKKARQAIGEYLLPQAANSPDKAIVAGRYKAKAQQNNSDSVNVGTLLNLCRKYNKDPIAMLSAKKKEVDEQFGDIPEATFELQTTMKRMPNAAFLNVTVSGAKRKSPTKKGEAKATEAPVAPAATMTEATPDAPPDVSDAAF